MTPLDDQLRESLSTHAAQVAPSSDPLAGIEARATRIRRRRVAAAVTGAAAAVAAVALVVPGLLPERTTTVQPGATPPASVSASASPSAAPSQTADVPANLLHWELRGTDAVSPSTLDLRTRFAQALNRSGDAEQTMYSPLYVDRVDGVAFTTGQAWFDGSDNAYTVSYAVGPDNVPQFFLGPVTPTAPWGLAFLISGIPGHDLLVVVPRPGIGQVSYSAHASGGFDPVANGRSDLDGIGLVERGLNAFDDRLEVLDGDGNMDHPLYRGPVTPLLCGLKDCG